MKKHARQIYIFVIILSAIVVLVFSMNTVSMARLVSERAEEMGQMQIEIIAAELQADLNEAAHSLDRMGPGFEALLARDADDDEIRAWLSEQKKNEIASTGRTCTNVYCVTRAGTVLISDMEPPEGFVIQDRVWYQGVIAVPKGEVYISPVYDDAFTEGMCFTVSKVLSDGETILAVDYSTSEIQSYIERMNASGHGGAMVVNNNGLIVGYTDPALIGRRLSEEDKDYSEAFARANAQDASGSISVSTASHDWVYCSRVENDWYLMLLVNNWDLSKDGYRQLIVSSAAILLMIVIFAAFSIVAVKERFRTENTLRKREELISEFSNRFHAPLRNIVEISASAAMNTEELKPAAEGIRLEAGQLSNMIDNLFSYSNMLKSDRATAVTGSDKTKNFNISTQHHYRFGIIVVFLLTMFVTILISGTLHVRWAKSSMTEEANTYGHQVSSWELEQQSILGMFVNEVVADPDMVNDYDGMVKWLYDISRHYPRISVAYIANPAFEAIHGHQMIMNNGWIPAEDYVVERRKWYTDALEAEDYCISEPYYDVRTGQYCLSFTKAVYTDAGQFVGVFGLDFYLNTLADIIDTNLTEDGYAFLADPEGRIIDHPNPAYRPWDGGFVELSDLPYGKVYEAESGTIGTITDYDGTLRECIIVRDDMSHFSIVVVKDFWSMYGDVLRYAVLYGFLFSICIAGVSLLINRMIQWQKSANENLSHAVENATSADNAKSQFLAQVSHEIRTPINAMLGMNEMILRENGDPKIEEYSENIKSAGNTLLSLVNEILDLSKIESGKMEIIPVKYDTASLINDLVNMVSDRAAQKGLAFNLDVDREIPASMYGDDIRLKQIIVNLLTNAVKYTEKGSVTLTMRASESENNTVVLHVSVADTGIGIKEQDMTKLYDAFQRIEEERTRNIEGTGLGIPITHNLLKMMGSSLNVSSVYGEGSVFSFDVRQGKMTDEPIGDLAERRQHSLALESMEKYVYAPDADILVVDDNEMNLKVAQGLTKRNAFVPDTAQSGPECIEKVSHRHYDMIFMDHMMPGMDGVATLNALKEQGLLPDDTAVIAMTANAIVGAKEEYLQAGFVDYLSKPIVVKKLEEALARYLPKEKVSYKYGGQAEKAPVSDTQPKEGVTMATSAQELGIRERFSFLDTEAGLRYCANDEAFYLEMVQAYLESDKRRDLEKYYGQKDWDNYRIIVHALKSTSLSIGAVGLSEKAKALENAARDKDADYIERNHAACMDEYNVLLGQLAAALRDKSADRAQADADADRALIFVVDDDRMNLRAAERLLGDTYTVNCASSGAEALAYLKTYRPDMILLDVHMPGMDGFDVLKQIHQSSDLTDIPVIFLTADDDQNAEVRGFEEGAVDFIRKPFIAEIMLKRVQRMLELSRLQHNLEAEVRKQTRNAEERRERVERLSQEAVLCLVKAIDAKDKYTNGHSERVAQYAREIARRAGMSETEQKDIYVMGLLHDIGKIGVPDNVINKPGKLTDEEFALVKRHSIVGSEILKDVTEMPGIGQGARWHHERYGGGGYPDNISGESIPIYARIICVADAYDAMTSNRSYRDVLSQEHVRSEIERGKGVQFDPVYAQIMLQMIDEDKNYEMRER